jgi:sulfur relay (sulfurtransferase) DsrC/TusE family protein
MVNLYQILIIDMVVDTAYFIDIVANFFTTYINEKTELEVKSLKLISIRYLKFYFWVDFIAILPIDRIVKATLNHEGSNHLAAQKFIKLFRLLKTLRLRKAFEKFKIINEVKFGIKIVILVLCLLVTIHYITCIWYLLIVYEYNEYKH